MAKLLNRCPECGSKQVYTVVSPFSARIFLGVIILFLTVLGLAMGGMFGARGALLLGAIAMTVLNTTASHMECRDCGVEWK